MIEALYPSPARGGVCLAGWGLLAVVAAAGCARESVPSPGESAPRTSPGTAWFEEIAEKSGVDFVCRSGHRERFLFPEILHGGGALFDMDGDGDLDLYLVQAGSVVSPGSPAGGNRLYRNDGKAHFVDVTEGSGADHRGYGMGVACGDYDNDGLPDLYVTNLGPNVLLHNEGGGRFTDATSRSGTGDPRWGASASFVDYDADGDLDLFVTNYVSWTLGAEIDCYNAFGMRDYCLPTNYNAPARDTLFRNEGDGTFTDVTVSAGMAEAFGNGLGVGCGDYDGDGRLDIFVANDTMMDQLWINRGDGRFTDEALLRGCALDEHGKAKAGMGVATGDLDDDGDLDLLVVNLARESDSYFRNEGGFFVDGTGGAGLGSVSRRFTRFGAGFVDFDNDGFLDLYEANGRVQLSPEPATEDPFAEVNLLFRGRSGGRFEEVLPRGGTQHEIILTSRAAVFGDVDDDGGVDVVVVNRDGPVQLLRNIAPEHGHWITFRVLERSGRDALGAMLSLRLGERRIMRAVESAYSYLAANDPRVHVGLGGVGAARGVTVRWVDGAIERFGDFEADQFVELRRGEGIQGAL